MSDRYVGTIVSAGASQNNQGTAGPFAVMGGQMYSVQPDVAVYVATGLGAATAATATGVRIEANQLYDIRPGAGEDAIAILPVVAGAANAKTYLKGG
jgi:hypothetical protein